MIPRVEVFQGRISVVDGQTFLQQDTKAACVQTLIIGRSPGNLRDRIAAATAFFGPFDGTIQRFEGTLTFIGEQKTILVG